MNGPSRTGPEPLLALAIKELLSGPPVEAALWPEYLETIKVLREHPGTTRIATALLGRGENDEDSGNA